MAGSNSMGFFELPQRTQRTQRFVQRISRLGSVGVFLCALCVLCVLCGFLPLLVSGCSAKSKESPKKKSSSAKSVLADDASSKAAPDPASANNHRIPKPGASANSGRGGLRGGGHPLAGQDRTLENLLEQADDPFSDGFASGGGNARSGGDDLKPFTPAERYAAPNPSYGDVDEAALTKNGIRRIDGKHLTLFTDLPSSPEVDALPRVFDAAFPQWCAYFGLDAARYDNWKMFGRLMKEPQRFRAAGLFGPEVPNFNNGYQIRDGLWLNEQSTAYYRRHLLLHEGTHGLMSTLLGGMGPPWYSEGMAELFATHQWAGGQLTTGYFPRDKRETPDWGRVKILQDEVTAGNLKSLADVMKYGWQAHLRNEPYAWCWAAAEFLDTHPDSRAAFREMKAFAPVTGIDFSRRLSHRLGDRWSKLEEQWQLFVGNCEYGYDIEREAIIYRDATAIDAGGGGTCEIAADRGWQSSGYELLANETYTITASGRFQIAADPAPWISEANGVTIRYHNGKPLGVLLAAVRNDDFGRYQRTPLLTPEVIGLGRPFTPNETGTLYFRVNDHPAELIDNRGKVQVNIQHGAPEAAQSVPAPRDGEGGFEL